MVARNIDQSSIAIEQSEGEGTAEALGQPGAPALPACGQQFFKVGARRNPASRRKLGAIVDACVGSHQEQPGTANCSGIGPEVDLSDSARVQRTRDSRHRSINGVNSSTRSFLPPMMTSPPAMTQACASNAAPSRFFTPIRIEQGSPSRAAR